VSDTEHQAQAPDGAAPSLEDSLRQVGRSGKAGLTSALDTARALRKLALADFALARVAMARAMVWMSVAAVFGVCSWLLLMGVLIALLQHNGFSWLASVSIAAGLSLAMTILGVVQTLRYFEFTRMEATRRQLKAMGIGDDDEDEDEETPGVSDTPVPQSAAPAPAGVAEGGRP